MKIHSAVFKLLLAYGQADGVILKAFYRDADMLNNMSSCSRERTVLLNVEHLSKEYQLHMILVSASLKGSTYYWLCTDSLLFM
jgi:hypothetical protein